MKTLMVAAVAASLLTPPAFAQDTPAQSGPQNPAVKSMDENNSSTPVRGANSFTRGEAKSRLEARGYTNVTKLTKDANGIWRGMAQKDGKSVTVTVDYQGNVNEAS